MIDLKELEKKGYDPKKLRVKFESVASGGKAEPGIRKLIDIHQGRIDEGIRRCLRHARVTKAIDEAFNAPIDQTSYTLLRAYLSRHEDSKGPESLKEAQELALNLGLGSLLSPVQDASGNYLSIDGMKVKNPKDAAKKVNIPVFTTTLMPVVLSLVRTRQASLFQEIDQNPFFKYEPNVLGPKDRAIAKVTTQRVERSVSDTGVRQVVRQSILQALKYGVAINFPTTSWWQNKQIIDGVEKVAEEGIKYETPHPARMFWDQNHPAYTLNLNTGCQYAGFWKMVRYSEVKANAAYWNTDKLQIGENTWRSSADYGWYTKFYPCQVHFPNLSGTTGTGRNDRENKAYYYANKAPDDAGVDQVVLFDRIVPKDFGLYDYEYPVWHRFVYAGDRVVIHCEPWLYDPLAVDLYDNDAQADLPISLALEVVPHQDMFTNLLQQMVLTVKKNLIRILGINTDAVSQADIDRFIRNPENAIRGISVMEYSGQKLERQGLKFSELFTPANLQQIPISEQIQMLSTYLSFTERVLGFSPHELGASASHQISAKEAQINAAGNLSRRSLTASHIADGMFRRKVAHYDAMMAYGSDDILVEVANLEPGQAKLLEEAGFEVTGYDGQPGVAVVKGKKSSLKFSSLFSNRGENARTNDAQLAAQMFGVMDRVSSNPQLVQMLGPDQVARIYNAAISLSGLPEEMRMSLSGMKQTPEQMKVLIGQIQQIVNQQLEQLGQKVLQPMVERGQQVEQAIGQLAPQVQQSGQAVGELAQKQQAGEQAIAGLAQQLGVLSESVSKLMEAIVPTDQTGQVS